MSFGLRQFDGVCSCCFALSFRVLGMSRHLKIAGALAAIVLLGAVVGIFNWHRVDAWAVGIHQKSTTRELAAWGQEFTQIRSDDEADRAVGMLRYVEGYYVPGPGYRSSQETESALETQRRKTLDTMVKALEE